MCTLLWLLTLRRRLLGNVRATLGVSQQHRSVRLRLEHLEDRLSPAAIGGVVANNNSDVFQGILDQVNGVINGVFAGASPSQLSSAILLFGASSSGRALTQMPPPALVSLYIDGVSLEVTRLGIEHVNYGNEIILDRLGAGPPPSAEALQFENALQPWLQFVYQARGNQSLNAVLDDIHTNLPQAGPLGVLAFYSGIKGVQWTI